MGRGVSSGGGQSSLGYLFGSGEAPKPSTNGAQPAPDDVQAVNNVPPSKPAVAPQPVDASKQIPAGINSSSANNYMRADGQNAGNFITDRPSTKVHAAPGGGSSLGYLFGDGSKGETDGWEEEEEVEPQAGDGGDGGGVVLQGVPWGEQVLSIAREVLLQFADDLELYAFKTTHRGYVYVRLDKLSNEYGCPSMEELESYCQEYKKRLEEAGKLGQIPDDLALEAINSQLFFTVA
ncbi:hypothetical protein GH714_029632 [Hevea brasiliensis]|uniref:Uncharacterized protein n=2 Tax=Hevea brasiliensis TaxID=3981 RepID=A0A6A6L5L6_HEVBR|nr:hypothetical protein GH714_029632 [Hevea brasiliensis]